MKIKGIAWIGIVSDDSAVRDFYTHTLQLKLLDEAQDYVYYAVDEVARLEILASASRTAAQQRPDAPAIGFLVDDLDESVAELSAQGVQLLTDIKEWRSGEILHRWVYFADPGGNILLLLERHGDEQAGE
ncbi:MAG: VOC family protein [Anaerolineales bacterium]|nr:VOC family protein [Anaerolineales bacterium]